tara:strand:- start:1124 stop:2170 length:1047 start_codon:yes stop_codon:yes gene_type:complete
MLNIKRHGVLLRPSKNKFESKGVFNPACIKKDNEVHMFYRAWDHTNKSTIGYAKLDGPLKVVERWDKPFMTQSSNTEYSIEDPRIVKIGDTYYLTYIAYDGKNVRIAYATSNDLITFKKQGVVSPNISYDKAEDIFRACQSKLKERYFLFESFFKDIVGKDVLLWDKDAFLFPKKIKGKYALVHRILPDIQVIYFKNFKDLTLAYWKKYFDKFNKYVMLESKYWFESRNIGGGCPPILTDQGWLLIYHAVDDMNQGKIYRAGAALLDRHNPTKEIGRLREPLIVPEKSYEKIGNVNNVVFPTGAVEFDDRLYIYYGAADSKIATFSVKTNDLIKEILKNKTTNLPKNI